jgi:hypothetical protein
VGFLGLLEAHLEDELLQLGHFDVDEVLLPVIVGAGGLGPVVAKAFELEVHVEVVVVFQGRHHGAGRVVLEERDSLLDEDPRADEAVADGSAAAFELKGLLQQLLAVLVGDVDLIEKTGKGVAKDSQGHVCRLDGKALLVEAHAVLDVRELLVHHAGRAHLAVALVRHEARGGVVDREKELDGLAVRHGCKRSQGVVLIYIYLIHSIFIYFIV